MERVSAGADLEPGSFRDPDSRIVVSDGRVLRLLSEQGLADWRALSSSSLFAELVDEGKLVATQEAEDVPAVRGGLHGPVAAALEHEVVPFVSYPYEWTFGMLRDAALLQLELVRRAIEAGMMLKDSSPYNVQFRGARPVFVDVGSFEPLREGEPWAGYRQFCTLFLYPLLLQAWKDVPFQPWLRGRIDGISPQECRNLMSARDLLRRGVLTHVVLHSKLERRYADSTRDLKRELKSAGFRKELIVANVKGLERLVSRLRWARSRSAWSGYGLTTTYSAADAERKKQYVAEAVAAERPRLVWDLGCNEGRHARIAAETADHVVAMDADAVVVDRLYNELGHEGTTNVLPLAVNIVDPSPGLGWRGLERRPLPERGSPDLTLCLALIHHVSIGGNVPVAEFLDWLHGLSTALVIEFPTPEDPMVQGLLARKRPGDHPDYRREWFERCLSERFDVVRS
ncbi:MAG: methyltransferase, partial [Gaiellaceae bacterium]